MTPIYFTPGPSQLYPTVKNHIGSALERDILSLSHRSSVFKTIFSEAVEGIRDLLDVPRDYEIVFVASATEAMERTIQNMVEHVSLHVVTGDFGNKFAKIATQLHKRTHIHPLTEADAVNSEAFPPELLCFTHNETSNGYRLPLSVIVEYKKRYPDALVALDVVSSVPVVDLDFSFLDSVFFSVQKGFGVPAGLGVMILSPKALEKAEKLKRKGLSIGSYHDFPTLVGNARKLQTPETPNILALYLLGNVIKDMQQKGKKRLFEESKEKAQMLYALFEGHDAFDLVINDKATRSHTVVVVKTPTAGHLISALHAEGMHLGKGYGSEKETQIRIANFPAHSLEDVENLVSFLKSY